MGEQDNVTLGEVYRLCQSIERKVEKQNGRVEVQESRLDALEKDAIRIKTVWSVGVVLASVGGSWIKSKVGL